MEINRNNSSTEQKNLLKTGKVIQARIAVLMILLIVTIAGSLVWYNEFKYTPSELVEATIRLPIRKVLPKFYSIKNNKMYYYDGPIVGTTDPATFQYIGHYNYNDYAKDKSGVYFNNRTIDGADPKTFQYIGGEYTKDKNHIYTARAGFNAEGNYSGADAIIKDADTATFQYIGGAYARDAKNVFMGNQVVKNADLSTFIYLGGLEADKYTGPMDRPLDEGYAKDKEHIYFYGNSLVMKDADHATFRDIGGGYAKDKGGVYCNGTNFVVPSDTSDDINDTFTVDISTFEYIGDHYTKDKDNVYWSSNDCRHMVVQGAVPSECTATNLTGCKGI